MRAILVDERGALVDFLVHLDELDRRRGYEEFGQPKLWHYCTRSLGMCDATAYRRIETMRLIRQHPEIADRLRDGRVCVTTLMILKDALRTENATRLLDLAFGKPKEELLRLAVAMNAPIQPVSSIRPAANAKVVSAPPEVADLRSGEIPTGGTTDAQGSEAAADASAGPVEPRVDAGQAVLVIGAPKIRDVKPVSANQSVLTVTIDRAFEEELGELRDALSHVVRDGDLAELLRYCVKKELDRVRKRNGIAPGGGDVAVEKPSDAEQGATQDAGLEPGSDGRSGKGTAPGVASGTETETDASLSVGSAKTYRVHATRSASGGRKGDAHRRKALPVVLRRSVWKRDRGRCQFRLKNGRICGSTWKCEIDHIIPVAHGGKSDEDNLRVVCRGHNLQAEREVFGDALVDRFTNRGTSAREPGRAGGSGGGGDGGGGGGDRGGGGGDGGGEGEPDGAPDPRT